MNFPVLSTAQENTNEGPMVSGYDQVTSMFSSKFKIPVEIMELVFAYLSITALNDTFGASYSQLRFYLKNIGFQRFKMQLEDTDGHGVFQN